MALSGAGPALVVALSSIVVAVLLGMVHHKRPGDPVASDPVAGQPVAGPDDAPEVAPMPHEALVVATVEESPQVEPSPHVAAGEPMPPTPVSPVPAAVVPEQPPAPPVERLRVVRDILPGR